ncbi:hypothetical protein GALL_408680 [mine drainage metagenome]|jgi:hypothetical protein|uniref:Polyketide cyclase / dehydrase and lipid transport n=1 Tax=mine drainage metagenome TaxID=410659 RepID=A0A1J5QN51_9ZZZZ
MLESQIVGVSIKRRWNEVYEAIWRPESFPKWASGLSQSSVIQQSDGTWRAEGPNGSLSIRFTEHNPYGVMDHYVLTEAGMEVYVPMRVIANLDGADVALTLFRHPEMSDSQFLRDLDWVRRDLATLQSLLESAGD